MFYIIEIQKTDAGVYSHLVYTAASQNEAESIYYDKLHYAAVSNLPLHTVVLITDEGFHHMSKAYKHNNPIEE